MNMRIGILADIHANLEALTAVLSALQDDGAERYWCLGDVVGYGADPEACIELLRRLPGSVCIAGNHDQAAVGSLGLEHFNPYARAAAEWTAEMLSTEARSFLERLPLLWQQGRVTLVHGSLDTPEAFHYVFDRDTAISTLSVQETPLCLVGHAHVPVAVCAEHGRVREVDGDSFDIGGPQRWVVNVGSVGQPRDGDPRAAYGVYDEAEGRMTMRRVAYDVETAAEKIREAGLPPVLADRLFRGR